MYPVVHCSCTGSCESTVQLAEQTVIYTVSSSETLTAGNRILTLETFAVLPAN